MKTNKSNVSRRAFVGSSLAALGGVSASLNLFAAGNGDGNFFSVPNGMTVQQVMDLVIRNVPSGPRKETVDTLKSGKPEQIVTGIVTTMFATIDVIRKAAALNANFIIAHEPTFYNHFDKTEAFEQDPVYQFKRDLLARHSIAVWRCHDYIHSFQQDGIDLGVLQTLGWEKYADSTNGAVINLPGESLEKIIHHVKEKLGQTHVRVIGNLAQHCSKIVLLPGASGGTTQISMTREYKPDLLIVGELSEWETAEYIRDAIASGTGRSLIIIGHALSEEPGMKWMAGWLKHQVSPVSVTHVPSQDPFTWV